MATRAKIIMGTRALIVGKDKNGQYRYTQTVFDGYNNTKWLQNHMTDPDKVEKFLLKITKGGENGNGCGRGPINFSYNSDGKPRIKWGKGDYNSGIAKSKEEMLEVLTLNSIDHFDNFVCPEYLSYWNGKEWLGVGWDTLHGGEDEGKKRGWVGWVDNWRQFAPLVANN